MFKITQNFFEHLTSQTRVYATCLGAFALVLLLILASAMLAATLSILHFINAMSGHSYNALYYQMLAHSKGEGFQPCHTI